MTKRLLPSLLSFGLASVLALPFSGGCGAKVATVLEAEPDGGSPGVDDSGGKKDGNGNTDEDQPLVPASKVDILLVVDNSTSMSDKSSLLAGSLGTLIRNVATGRDVHLGVITSSLGNSGGDVCDEARADTNGHAHLRTTGENGNTVAGAESGVLSYAGGDVDTFVSRAEDLVRGVGQDGCGLEAQLESMYRFLVQPDPWEKVTVPDGRKATLGAGIDMTLIAQRSAFLRPDSALVVLMITDEDDASIDPRSINGQGWAFATNNFPGSTSQRSGGASAGRTAPRGTDACETDPGSPDCISCAFESPRTGVCLDNDGFYGPSDDDLNVRFHDMKQRYGVDPQFPLQRYIDGLTKSMVPDRSAEHVTTNDTVAPYTHTAKCTNPIFAAELPKEADSADELCNLARGPRSRELVLFALLGGLPKELATASPDWTKIVGNDPANYDRSGIDPHMIQSTEPRPGLPGPNGAATDPVHGREYNTNKSDLQYACTFALPTARSCPPMSDSCDCSEGSEMNPPLCGAPGEQLRAKAYPTIRPLRLAQGLGERGIIGSVCATDYADVLDLVNQRLATRLAP